MNYIEVQRCDASILLASNPSAGIRSELMSGGNLGIRRLDIIGQVKKDLEAACPNTVSCADIVAMVGRDAVSITGDLTYLAASWFYTFQRL